jgi:hypothetical protein
MDQQTVSGSLASGGSFRATPTLLEIMTPTGEVAATFDARYFEDISRDGQKISISRIGNSTINVTTATPEEADALEQVVRAAAESPTPATPDPGLKPEGTDSGFNGLLKWGCIGTLAVVGVLAVCLILLLVVFRDGDDDDGSSASAIATATLAADATATPDDADAVPDSTPASSEPTPAPDATATEPGQEPTEGTEPDPTATSEPEPIATPGAPGSARDNPVPFGEVLQIEDWEVQVLEVVRGEDAYDILLETNQFNSPPPPGHEFVLVNLTARYIADSSEVVDIDSFWLRSTGDSRVRHTYVFPVNPEPVFDASLFSGGEVTGWATVLAREGESNLLLVFEEWLDFDEDVSYLALEEGASVEPISGRLAEENDLGFDVNNPVPFGERAVGENWEIRVIESIRGQDALDMVMEANQFNDEPQAGMEYVLVHVGARNVGTSSGVESISEFSFEITGDSNRIFENPFVVSPEPALDFEMYPGGEASGWITLEVPEGEQNLRLVYEPWLSFTAQQRFFALE